MCDNVDSKNKLPKKTFHVKKSSQRSFQEKNSVSFLGIFATLLFFVGYSTNLNFSFEKEKNYAMDRIRTPASQFKASYAYLQTTAPKMIELRNSKFIFVEFSNGWSILQKRAKLQIFLKIKRSSSHETISKIDHLLSHLMNKLNT